MKKPGLTLRSFDFRSTWAFSLFSFLLLLFLNEKVEEDDSMSLKMVEL